MSENTSQGPEPGTNEWAYETGNYIDPEPDWDSDGPHLDTAHGVAYWDTASEVDAGRERYSGYRHVGRTTRGGVNRPATRSPSASGRRGRRP